MPGPVPGSTASPGVTVVPGDIPGATPVGSTGSTATSTTTAAASTSTTTTPTGEQCVPDPNYRPNPAKQAFERLKDDLDELKEYASLYVAAKVDGIKVTIRNIGLYAALGLLGAIVGGAMLATAAGLIVVGIARGLGALFGGRLWLGDLVTGILILGAVAAGAYFMMNKLTGAWRSQTLKKYEQRKQTQRERFGHDVSSRAREAAAAAQRAAAAAGGPGGQKGR